MKTYNLTFFESSVKWLVAALFLYAAFSKGFEFHKFLVQLSGSPLVPRSLVYATAFSVIGGELVIVFLIMRSKLYLVGLWLSYSVMLFFSLYIYYLLNFPDFVPCACGGILGSLGHKSHMYFNITVTLLTLSSLFTYYLRENHLNSRVSKFEAPEERFV